MHPHSHPAHAPAAAQPRPRGLSQHILTHLHDTELWADYLPQVPPRAYLLAGLGLALIAGGLLLWRQGMTPFGVLGLALGALLLALPAVLGAYVLWRRRNSRSQRAQILGAVAWRGDEHVLDVGCGNGLLLNGAAQRVPSGQAVGLDLWAPHSGGGTEALLWKNARQERVADRIVFKQGDARQMPFADAAFDVVVSSSAVHHMVRGRADFEQVAAEMLRVLKPGGQIIIADVTPLVEACAARFQAGGLACEVKPTGRFFVYDRAIVFGRKPS